MMVFLISERRTINAKVKILSLIIDIILIGVVAVL